MRRVKKVLGISVDGKLWVKIHEHIKKLIVEEDILIYCDHFNTPSFEFDTLKEMD